MSNTKNILLVEHGLLAAGPSLHYVSDTVKSLRLESLGYPADHHACAFIVLPAPQDATPVIAFGSIAPTRDAALQTLADAWSDGMGKYPTTGDANPMAINALQLDVSRSPVGGKMAKRILDFTAKLDALGGDPVLVNNVSVMAACMMDILHLLGEDSFDVHILTVLAGCAGGFIENNPEEWLTYLRDKSPASVQATRAELGLAAVPTNPEQAN